MAESVRQQTVKRTCGQCLAAESWRGFTHVIHGQESVGPIFRYRTRFGMER